MGPLPVDGARPLVGDGALGLVDLSLSEFPMRESIPKPLDRCSELVPPFFVADPMLLVPEIKRGVQF